MKAILILTVAIFILLSLPFSAQSQTPITAVPQGGPIMGLIPIAVNPSTGYSQPAAVFANNLNTYFVAYRSSLNEIILTSVAPSGALLNSFALSSAREFYDRSAPDLDYDPDHTQALVVWEAIDPSDGYRDIRGRIFAGGSSTFDFSICEGALGAQCFHPAVA